MAKSVVVDQLSPAAAAYVTSIALAAVITGGIATFAWRRRSIRGAGSLAVTMAGATVWNACNAVQIVTNVDSVVVSVQTLKLGSVAVVVTGLFALALELSNRETLLDRRTKLGLAIEPVAIVVLTGTNRWHGLVWDSISPAASTLDTVQAEAAVGFWLHTVYAYGILTVAVGILLVELLRSRAVYRRQAAAVLAGALVPIVANLLMLVGVLGIDLQPFAFAITGEIVARSIRRDQLIDLVPVAREQVVETLPDPVIVLDEHDRITDLNQAGSTLLGNPETELIGTEFAATFGDDEVVDLVREAIQTRRTVKLPVGDAVRVYEIRVTPIQDRQGAERGRVLVFHDVTEREQRRQELEHQNDQLERFASVVSHDLRNPLSVAEGYLPMARETGDDDYFEAVEESLERMNVIIEDVLTLAREGSHVEDFEPVSLEDVARTAWEQVSTKGATLRVEADVTINADENRLQRLLENLFRNSIEHGPEKIAPSSEDASPEATGRNDDAASELTVTVGPVTPGGEDALSGPTDRGFYVEDDGGGIPPDRRGEIFEPGNSSSSAGTGLGLSIVQGIAKAHGWSVRATDAESGGARFEITGVASVDTAADVVESAEPGAQR